MAAERRSVVFPSGWLLLECGGGSLVDLCHHCWSHMGLASVGVFGWQGCSIFSLPEYVRNHITVIDGDLGDLQGDPSGQGRVCQ